MTIDLSGKVILLTGSSRGIGKAVARQAVNSGASLVLHYNQHPEGLNDLLKEWPERLFPIQADLSNPDDIKMLFQKALDHFGKIDILINNAGVAIDSDLEKNDHDWLRDWQKTMVVNLTAVGYLCKLAIPQMISQGTGIIINISSRAAFRGDTPDFLAYAASKGGVVPLTRSIARAYGKDGIIAFNIAPGFTKTDMAGDFIEKYGENFVTSDLALDEITRPEHIADIVIFLCSGKARHATGTTIDVNAGSYVH